LTYAGCGGTGGQSDGDTAGRSDAGSGSRSDGGSGDRSVGSSITYYDCTVKDSTGKFVNTGKPCASACATMPDPAGFTWLYAGTDGTCVIFADGLMSYCNYATMTTCGSTQGSTCSGGADSGVNAHCN
jgi:hypothetical protein